MRTGFFLFLIVFLFNSFESMSQMADTKVLGLADAVRITDAAEKRARQDKWNVVIAVVDAGGHLISLKRLDGTQIGSVEVAIKKAQAAVYFKRPTKAFQERVEAGAYGVMSLPNVMPVEGGIPIEHEGKIIGAIGVSGVTSEQDGIIGQAGISAL
ncbi:heme-binding protein [soil metagenome]